MYSASVFPLLVVLLAAYVASYSLHLTDLHCPPDAEIKLDRCLTNLEHLSSFELLQENCGPALESLRCSNLLVRSCMDNYNILKVLSEHDLISAIPKIKSVCMGSRY